MAPTATGASPRVEMLTPNLDSQMHLGFAGMWNCVATKFDVWILIDKVAQGVSQRVIFLFNLEGHRLIRCSWQLFPN